ncbi:alkaline phosphatase [uncultured Cyclobacterium sp.]|uniref:alkaline phosphatase n=1 Tax=uncultured Cyclobacterium sp. TaxID=453820 RepID=UPI0030ECA245
MNCKKLTIMLLFPAILLSTGALHAQVKKVKHVVLLGLDGLGSYAIPKAEMPNLKRIMDSGSYSLKARTVLPSSSAVNWASMLMASGPTAHGYTEWGSKTPEIPSAKIGNYGIYPSIFGLIREQMPKAKTAAIFSWGGIEYLLEKDAIDIVTHVNGDDLCTEKAVEVIVNEKPNFMFIHLDQPDGVGHGIGHDTPEYYEELKNVDKRIGLIYRAIEEAGIADETIFMLSSDHGGTGKGHGGKSPEEVYIPWLIEGRGIKKNHEISDLIMTYDTAATIAWIFGLEMQQVWRGKPVLESIK